MLYWLSCSSSSGTLKCTYIVHLKTFSKSPLILQQIHYLLLAGKSSEKDCHTKQKYALVTTTLVVLILAPLGAGAGSLLTCKPTWSTPTSSVKWLMSLRRSPASTLWSHRVSSGRSSEAASVTSSSCWSSSASTPSSTISTSWTMSSRYSHSSQTLRLVVHQLS